MTVQEYIKIVQGDYTLKSPYHKNKRLPFIITGRQWFTPEHPIEVNTVEYKGWTKHDINTGYSIESIKWLIESGTIKHRRPTP